MVEDTDAPESLNTILVGDHYCLVGNKYLRLGDGLRVHSNLEGLVGGELPRLELPGHLSGFGLAGVIAVAGLTVAQSYHIILEALLNFDLEGRHLSLQLFVVTFGQLKELLVVWSFLFL